MWALHYRDGTPVEPRRYSNGKTQADLVSDIYSASYGENFVFLHSAAGSGKSAVALNVIYFKSQKANVVVPTRALQAQYRDDYDADRGRFYIGDGSKLKIAVIWGRQNFTCKLLGCPAHKAPCTQRLGIYAMLDQCPYYAPPLPKPIFEKVQGKTDLEYVTDYRGLRSTIVITRRPKGVCDYYAQFEAYHNADVVVMNAVMWKMERRLGRLRQVDYYVIDEVDATLEFFDPKRWITVWPLRQLYEKLEVEKERTEDVEKVLKLMGEVKQLIYYARKIRRKDDFLKWIEDVCNTISQLEIHIVDEELKAGLQKYFEVKELLNRFYSDYEVHIEGRERISLIALDPARYYRHTFFEWTSPGLLMSATLPGRDMIESMWGIKGPVIEGEVKAPGKVYLGGTFELTVSGGAVRRRREAREAYNKALDNTKWMMRSQISPRLWIVTAYHYVKFDEIKREAVELGRNWIVDETGRELERLRRGEVEELWTTRAFRGVDLPNVHAIGITKYPYPDLSDPFWRLMFERRRPTAEKLYHMVAEHKLYQFIARALRDESCWVVIYSPDKNVERMVEELARKGLIELAGTWRDAGLLEPKVKVVWIDERKGEAGIEEIWRAKVEDYRRKGIKVIDDPKEVERIERIVEEAKRVVENGGQIEILDDLAKKVFEWSYKKGR